MWWLWLGLCVYYLPALVAAGRGTRWWGRYGVVEIIIGTTFLGITGVGWLCMLHEAWTGGE